MAQNTLTQNVKTATEVIKEVKNAITGKGVEIPEGTHAAQYPGYIAKMTSQTELEEFKEQVVLKGTNESEVKVSAPTIELNATENSTSGLSLKSGVVTLSGEELKTSLTGDISLETSQGNINLNTTTGEAQYKGVEIATVKDISGISTEITEVKSTVSSLDTKVKQNEKDIADLQTSVENNTGNIASIDNEVNSLKSGIETMEDRLSTAEQNLSGNIQDISDLNDQIDSIKADQSNYLPLSGGSMTRELRMNKGAIYLDNTDNVGIGYESDSKIAGLFNGEINEEIHLLVPDGKALYNLDEIATVNNLSHYLPLTGGKLTGVLDTPGIILDETDISAIAHVDNTLAITNQGGDIEISSGSGNIELRPGYNNKLKYNDKEIATVEHLNEYLPISGGAISGSLYMNDNTIYLGSDNIKSIQSIEEGIIIGVLPDGNNNSGIAITNEDIILYPSNGRALYGTQEIAVVDNTVRNINGVTGIAKFTTDAEAQAYSDANPNVLVISTEQ